MEYVDWLSFASSFLLVIVLLGGTLWGLKRFGRMQLQGRPGRSSLKILQSISVGARQRIVLVEVENQRMLLGITPQSISGLGQWHDNSKVKVPADFKSTLDEVSEEPEEEPRSDA